MKRLILFCVLFFLATGSVGQSFIDNLKQKVRSSQKLTSPGINIYFNQPYYSPGDTAFFSTFTWNKQSEKLEEGRKIIAISLWDFEGKPIVHMNILLTNGRGSDQIPIPLDLKPGIYSLTASLYQNKLIECQKDFIIVGETAFLNHPNINELEFFVEGGHLIEGVMNKITAKLKQPSQASEAKLLIKNLNGRILDEFSSNVEGLCKTLRDLPQEAWSRESRHETLSGELTLQLWVERSLAHIEEHLQAVRKV